MMTIELFNSDLLVLFTAPQLPTGVAGLTRLRHVDLSGNHFAEIPPPLLALPKLVTLNIGSCYHPEASCAFSRPPLAVPESLAAMTRLESLSLRNSNLRALPSTMVFPPRPAVLDLSWNRLQKVCEVHGCAVRLRASFPSSISV